MSGADGLIILLPHRREDMPQWWVVADGKIVARAQGMARPSAAGDAAAGTGGKRTVMLLLPPSLCVMRHVALDRPMPWAQARAVALHQALAMGVEEATDMHGVVLEPGSSGTAMASAPDCAAVNVAVIAKRDMAHIIAWAREQAIEPDILLPAAALLPWAEADGEVGDTTGDEPGQQPQLVSATIGGMALIGGQTFVAQADEPWLDSFLADALIRELPAQQLEDALIGQLENPAANLRSGAFAARPGSPVNGRWVRRIALLALAGLLLSFGISAALSIHYRWNAAQMDSQTVQAVKPYAGDVADAEAAAAVIDRLIAQKGGAYAFSGPLSGLMTAMQPVPGVSLTTLSFAEDGLLHATLAAGRADDINQALIALQAAGFKITATSSTDPGGRVIAQITVKP